MMPEATGELETEDDGVVVSEGDGEEQDSGAPRMTVSGSLLLLLLLVESWSLPLSLRDDTSLKRRSSDREACWRSSWRQNRADMVSSTSSGRVGSSFLSHGSSSSPVLVKCCRRRRSISCRRNCESTLRRTGISWSKDPFI